MANRGREFGANLFSSRVQTKETQDAQRKERLKQLTQQQYDFANDPYFMRNHLGTVDCRLCGTQHPNEANYLNHVTARLHQKSLKQRKMVEQTKSQSFLKKIAQTRENKTVVSIQKKNTEGIPPSISVIKQKDPTTKAFSILVKVYIPNIRKGLTPQHHFLNALEQTVERSDLQWLYLVIKAPPYENIAIKVPNKEIDLNPNRFFTYWNTDSKEYTLRFFYKTLAFTEKS